MEHEKSFRSARWILLSIMLSLLSGQAWSGWYDSDFCWRESYGRGVGQIPKNPPNCPSNSFPDPNGNCYSCPSDYYRTLFPPVTSNQACASGFMTGKYSPATHRGVFKSCEDNTNKPEYDAGLCYPKCSGSTVGIGPVCWGQCPATHPVNCGAGCATSKQACGLAVFDQVVSVLDVAISWSGIDASLLGKVGLDDKLSDTFQKELKKGLKGFSDGDAAKMIVNEYKKQGLNLALDEAEAFVQSATRSSPGDFKSYLTSVLTAADPTGLSGIVVAYTKPVCLAGPPTSTKRGGEIKFPWKKADLGSVQGQGRYYKKAVDIAVDRSGQAWALVGWPAASGGNIGTDLSRPGTPDVYRWNGSRFIEMFKAPGGESLVRLEIDNEDVVWAVSKKGELWYRDTKSNSGWRKFGKPPLQKPFLGLVDKATITVTDITANKQDKTKYVRAYLQFESRNPEVVPSARLVYELDGTTWKSASTLGPDHEYALERANSEGAYARENAYPDDTCTNDPDNPYKCIGNPRYLGGLQWALNGKGRLVTDANRDENGRPGPSDWYQRGENIYGNSIAAGDRLVAVVHPGEQGMLQLLEFFNKTWFDPQAKANRVAITPDGLRVWIVTREGDVSYTDAWSILHPELLVQKILQANSPWIQVPGAAVDVGTSDGKPAVWVTNKSDQIYKFSNNQWIKQSGAAQRISVSYYGNPWVVNKAGQVWRWANNKWVSVPGLTATDIAVSKNIWAISNVKTAGGYTIHEYDDSKKTWIKRPGGAVRIAVSQWGNPWVVNSAGQVWRWSNGTFQLVPGINATDIGIGANAHVWVTTDKQEIYFTEDGKQWKKSTGGAVTIDAGIDGTPWVINSAQQIWYKK